MSLEFVSRGGVVCNEGKLCHADGEVEIGSGFAKVSRQRHLCSAEEVFWCHFEDLGWVSFKGTMEVIHVNGFTDWTRDSVCLHH